MAEEDDGNEEDIYRQQQMRALQQPKGDVATERPLLGPGPAPSPAAGMTTVPPGAATIKPVGPKPNPLDLIKQFQGGIASSNATPGAVQELVKKLNASGVAAAVGTHAGGTQASTDKIVLPDGTYYDVQTDTGWAAPGGKPLHWDPNVNVQDAQGNFIKYGDFLKGQGLDVPDFVPTPGDGLPLPGYLGGAGPGNFGSIDTGQSSPYMTSDTLQQIMAELAATQTGDQSPRARRAQMAQLQQNQNE